jgi:DNA-binding IclR family transcriptional regulator
VILDLVKAGGGADAETARRTNIEALVQSLRERGYAPDRVGRPGPHRSIGVPVLREPGSEDVLGAIVMFWYLSVMPERLAAQRYLAALNDLASQISRGVAQHLRDAAPSADGHKLTAPYRSVG